MKAEGRSSRSQLLFDTGFLDSSPWREETAWAETSNLSERAAPQGWRGQEHEEHGGLFTRLGERRTRSCAVGATWTRASSEWPASGSSEWSPSHWPLGRWSRDRGSRHGRLLWSPPLLPSGRVPADTVLIVGITVFYTWSPPLKELYQLMYKKSECAEGSYLQNVGWDREDHGFVENGVGVIPFGGRLLLADLLAVL